jgi:hypothetical protein
MRCGVLRCCDGAEEGYVWVQKKGAGGAPRCFRTEEIRVGALLLSVGRIKKIKSNLVGSMDDVMAMTTMMIHSLLCVWRGINKNGRPAISCSVNRRPTALGLMKLNADASMKRTRNLPALLGRRSRGSGKV